MDRHQDENHPNDIKETWDEVTTNFNVAKTQAINSGYAFMGDLGHVWSVLSEGLKMVGDGVKTEATKTFQNLAIQTKNKVYSPWMDQGINTVKNILEQLKNNIGDTHNTNFLTLLMLLQRVREKQSNENILDESHLTREVDSTNLRLDHMKRFGIYALNMRTVVWRKGNKDVAQIMNVKENDILKTWFYDDDNDLHCPKFLIFVDHETKSIILGIRGTWSLRDALMDVVSDTVPYLGGRAHRGILDGAKKILKESTEVLETSLKKYPSYGLVICGHSLGGAVAQLVTLDIIYGEAKDKILSSNRSIACYAYGSPPVFVSNGEIVPIEVPQIKVFVNRADVVPTLSLATVAKALAQISASLDSLDLTFQEKFQMMFQNILHSLYLRWSTIRDGVFQNMYEATFYTQEIQANFENSVHVVLEPFVEASKRHAENVKMENETTVKRRKIESEIIIVDDISNDIAWLLGDDGSWNASFHGREEVNVSSSSENITFAKNVEDDDALSYREENPDEIVENEKTSGENVNEKIAKAAEAIKRVQEDDETHFFLRHPGTIYHMEKAPQNNLQSAGTGFILHEFSTQENFAFTRNIRLDIVNMVMDHLPPGYEEALNNLCP